MRFLEDADEWGQNENDAYLDIFDVDVDKYLSDARTQALTHAHAHRSIHTHTHMLKLNVIVHRRLKAQHVEVEKAVGRYSPKYAKRLTNSNCFPSHTHAFMNFATYSYEGHWDSKERHGSAHTQTHTLLAHC
jgi:hypothetical protein